MIAEEQKGSKRNTYGYKEQLVIDQLIFGQTQRNKWKLKVVDNNLSEKQGDSYRNRTNTNTER